MLLGSSPVPNVLRIVFVVSPIDQLLLLLFMLGVNAPSQSNLSLRLPLVILVRCFWFTYDILRSVEAIFPQQSKW